MDLHEQTIEVTRVLQGSDSYIIPASKTLVIETSPDGVEIFTGEVPEGKQWRVEISLKISESAEG